MDVSDVFIENMKTMPSENNRASLKSASGAGISFEDETAALLLCEMLTGQTSLGDRFGVVQRLEWQAGDWEPFGDSALHTGQCRHFGEMWRLRKKQPMHQREWVQSSLARRIVVHDHQSGFRVG